MATRAFRPGLRRGHGQHAGAPGLPAGMSQRCTIAREPRVFDRTRERVDGPHPERQGANFADLAVEWLATRQPVVATWLEGVHGFDGRPALAAVDELPAKRGRLRALSKPGSRPTRSRSATLPRRSSSTSRSTLAACSTGIAAVLTGSTSVVARILNGIPAPALILWDRRTVVGTAALGRPCRVCRAVAAVHSVDPGSSGTRRWRH